MRDIGSAGISRKPVIRQVKQGGTPHITQAATRPRRRKEAADSRAPDRVALALYEAMVANAQATTGGFPGMNSQGRPGVSGFGIEGNLRLAGESGANWGREPAVIGDEMPANEYDDESIADRAVNEHDLPFQGGLRFRPGARLDASQVDDRRDDPRTAPVGYDPEEPINAQWRAFDAEMNRRFPGGRTSKAAQRRRGR